MQACCDKVGCDGCKGALLRMCMMFDRMQYLLRFASESAPNITNNQLKQT